jgi:flagellar motility protein MotE (MotC chaperone)
VGVIKQLEVQIDTLTKERDDAATQIADLQAEVERLKVFEDQQLAFEERVKAFDKNVVFNDKAPSIEEYKAYYEEINPTTAEEIYRLVLEQLQYDESIIEKANIVKTMKPSQAAAVLQEMTADMEWVAKVLLSMKTDECAAIMDKMDQLYVAKIFKKMADMDEEKYNAIVQSLQ